MVENYFFLKKIAFLTTPFKIFFVLLMYIKSTTTCKTNIFTT